MMYLSIKYFVMGQPQVKNDKLSIAEWLEQEQSEGVRYEYHNGEVFAMAGGTLKHTVISGNAYRLLENNFIDKDKDCQAFISELKIEISKEGRYVYPDTLAVCGKVEESQSVPGAILNPVLVIEVTSKSSEAYDRDGKFHFYTSLPSVKQYMIVSQAGPFVTLYNRDPESGLFDPPFIEVRGLEGTIDLFSVGYQMPMQELYRKITFDKSDRFLYSV